MQSRDDDPDRVKLAWSQVLEAEQAGGEDVLARSADALENYAQVLKEANVRLLDAANAEAKAKVQRAAFFRLQEEKEPVSDAEIQFLLSKAEKESNRHSQDQFRFDWYNEERQNTAKHFGLWLRLTRGPALKPLKMKPVSLLFAVICIFLIGEALYFRGYAGGDAIAVCVFTVAILAGVGAVVAIRVNR